MKHGDGGHEVLLVHEWRDCSRIGCDQSHNDDGACVVVEVNTHAALLRNEKLKPAHAPASQRDGSAPTSVGALAAPSPVVIVGGGPTGIRVAQELSRRGRVVVLLNAERWQPYNRVKLTPLLSGDVQLGQVTQPLTFPGPGSVTLYSDQSIVDIDRDRKLVMGSTGRIWSYDKLVLCTGSRAHVPPIPGITLSGVYTFRNFDDVERLLARSFRSRRTVVIGGGLLGLEAARGMSLRGVETWVVEHEAHLMPQQLDTRAGQILSRDVTALGLTVCTGRAVTRVLGQDRVEGVVLGGNEIVGCDTIIVCTGIRPNMALAREIGLAVGRGITVGPSLQTSDPDIYAAGECAERDGIIYGLVGPGYDQALAAAAHICAQPTIYRGSVPATKLKVVGSDVFSMGDVEQLATRTDVNSLTYESPDGKLYRRLVLKGGRVVGAIAIGDWPEVNRLQATIRLKARVPFWQRLRFRHSGRIWPARPPKSVRDWPPAATVCNCTGVTRGQIGDAIAIGCATLADVKRDTGASTVCGSCRPLIEQLLGAPPTRTPIPAARSLLSISALSFALALLTLTLPNWPLAQSITTRTLLDILWLDGTAKQISGYTLLGLSAAAAVLSLRKRIRWLSFGGFTGWRLVHVSVGAAALLVLFAHTGFRLGSNLNMWVMAIFLALAAAGALSGSTAALEHRKFMSAETGAALRKASFWTHVIAFWPLPLLLAVHILSVYFY